MNGPKGVGSYELLKPLKRMMMFKVRVGIAIVFIVCYLPSSGQSVKIDSLEMMIHSAKGREKLNLLSKLTIELASFDIRQMQRTAALLSKSALEMSDTLLWIKGERLLASSYRRLERMDSSNFISLRILPIARLKDQNELSRILNGLALGYMYFGQYDLSLKCYFELYDIAVALKDKETISSTLNNLGLVYFKLENYSKAVEYYEQALNGCAAEDLIHRYINLTLCHIEANKLSMAKAFIIKTQNLDSSTNQYKVHVQHAWGLFYLKSRDYDSAAISFEGCLKTARQRRNIEYQIVSAKELANISVVRGEHKQADAYFLTAATLAERSTYAEEAMEVFNLMGKYYEQKGDFLKSFQYWKKYLSLKDSVYNKTLLNNLIVVESDFISKKKSQEIARQKSLIRSEKLIVEKRTKVLFFSLMASLLMVVMLVAIYKLYRQKRLINTILASKIESRTRELEFLHVESAKQLQSEVARCKKQCRDFEKVVSNIVAFCELGLKDEIKDQYFKQIKSITQLAFRNPEEIDEEEKYSCK